MYCLVNSFSFSLMFQIPFSIKNYDYQINTRKRVHDVHYGKKCEIEMFNLPFPLSLDHGRHVSDEVRDIQALFYGSKKKKKKY